MSIAAVCPARVIQSIDKTTIISKEKLTVYVKLDESAREYRAVYRRRPPRRVLKPDAAEAVVGAFTSCTCRSRVNAHETEKRRTHANFRELPSRLFLLPFSASSLFHRIFPPSVYRAFHKATSIRVTSLEIMNVIKYCFILHGSRKYVQSCIHS